MILGLGNTIPINSVRQGLGGGGGGGGFTNTYSLAFDGVDDNVIVPYNSSLDVVTSPHSLSFWLKTTDGSTQVVMEKGRGDELAVFIISNKIFWGGTNGFYGGTTVVNDGNWHNIVFVAGGSGVGSTIYIDGSSVATGNLKVQASANTDNFTIGTDANGSNAYDGQLDSVAIFNYALTSANVTSIYNSGVVNNLDNLSTSPIAWWRMGDNGSYKSPQWLIPNNSNKDKVSNYSFDFDGVDDKVSLTSLIPLGLTSISFWMKSTSSGNDSITSGLGNLGFIGTSPLVILSPSNYRYFADQASKFNGEWHHWFLLIAGSGQSDITNSRLFVDGVEISSGTTVNSGTPNSWTNSEIGRGNYGYLNCSINNFAVWEGSDESANVSTIYNSGTPNDISSLSPTVWLKMGEDATFSTNWSLPDNGSASNTGTSANMTIEDRVGDAPNSTSNALSYNMTESDREENVPS